MLAAEREGRCEVDEGDVREAVTKFDQMLLVDVRYLRWWGRTREIVLRYDVEAVERVNRSRGEESL